MRESFGGPAQTRQGLSCRDVRIHKIGPKLQRVAVALECSLRVRTQPFDLSQHVFAVSIGRVCGQSQGKLFLCFLACRFLLGISQDYLPEIEVDPRKLRISFNRFAVLGDGAGEIVLAG